MLTEYKPNRPLRLSQLEIPRVHTKQGESAFSYYAARSWNQLPEEIRCAKTLATFKSRLKTHLFSCAFVEWTPCYVRNDCMVYNHFWFLTVLNLKSILYHFVLRYIYIYIYTYSQVHKYWDMDTILTFLALYTTTMDFKWNEQDVL